MKRDETKEEMAARMSRSIDACNSIISKIEDKKTRDSVSSFHEMITTLNGLGKLKFGEPAYLVMLTDVFFTAIENREYMVARSLFAAAKTYVDEIIALTKEANNASRL
jgi:hypothetical protein